MRPIVPDMWSNRGRYRTRPDGSLYPREQRRLREIIERQNREITVGTPPPDASKPSEKTADPDD